jgi:hypothetical protein
MWVLLSFPDPEATPVIPEHPVPVKGFLVFWPSALSPLDFKSSSVLFFPQLKMHPSLLKATQSLFFIFSVNSPFFLDGHFILTSEKDIFFFLELGGGWGVRVL